MAPTGSVRSDSRALSTVSITVYYGLCIRFGDPRAYKTDRSSDEKRARLTDHLFSGSDEVLCFKKR